MPLKTIAYRLPQDLIDRIDKYAEMRTRVDDRPCTRSAALRMLLEKGLATTYAQGTRRVLETPAKAESITGSITDEYEPAQPLEEHEADEHPRKEL